MKNFFKKENEEKIGEYLSGKVNPEEEDFLSTKPDKKKKMAIVMLVFLFLSAVIFAYFSFNKGHGSFDDSKIGLSYDMPENVTSGEEVSLIISCDNQNDIGLYDTKLEITLPDGFMMASNDKGLGKSGKIIEWNIGDISAGSSEKIRLFGRFIGQTGEKMTISGKMTYTPVNFNSKFQTEKSAEIEISFSPIELSMEEKTSILNQSEEEFVFVYKNKSDRDFVKVLIAIDAGESFTLTSLNSEPAGTEDTDIRFQDEEGLAAGEEKKLAIKGIFDSQEDKEMIKAELYITEDNGETVKYAESENDINIEKSDILITQTVNGGDGSVAGKNEELEYKITFKNQSGEELRGLLVETYLDGNFDESSIEAENGTVDGNKIIWSAMKINELATLGNEAEGSVSFKVRVKNYFDITSAENKNFILESNTDVSMIDSEAGSDSVKKILASTNLKTKVKAFLYVDVKGYFNDDGRIENEGPLPPMVGQETSYTIHLIAKNFFNDTKNIRITAKLADNTYFTGKYINSDDRLLYQDPEPEEKEESEEDSSDKEMADDAQETKEEPDITEEIVYYDSDNREIVWEIPKMKANDGVVNSSKEIIFQIKIVPQEENVGQVMDIISGIEAEAFDEFIEQEIKYQIEGISTLLEDDYSIGEGESIVISNIFIE